MKIAIGVAPYKSRKGTPLLTQNRQFQWSKSGTVIYPVVLASCATVLKNAGHEVFWMDGIAEGVEWEDYLYALMLHEPDYLLWEVKTPVIKQTWKYIEEIKNAVPNTQIVLCGDHVTALPQKTHKLFPDVVILVGGDYDKRFYEYLHGEKLEKLPLIDRELTHWRDYAEKNGNFQSTPGAYTMFARDCWHRKEGGCTFCSWTNLYRDFNVCTPEEAIREVRELASLGVREIFDDSGTFPVGEWLTEFCKLLKEFNDGRKEKITMGCNMRSGCLTPSDWQTLRESGFRLILLGFESASEVTLKRLNKCYGVEDIKKSCRDASQAGLDVHITAMVGFPWESRDDAERTIGTAKDLLARGWAKTLQATVVVPYPGTKLFEEATREGWLQTLDWDDYDMSRPVLKSEIPNEEIMRYTREAYKACLTPSFILRNLFDKDMWRKAKYLFKRLGDFRGHS